MPSTHTPAAPTSATDRPTPKQMSALRTLAMSRGQSFTYPKTKAEASAEIRRLSSGRPISRYERRREQAHRQQVGTGYRDAATVRDTEVEGYGSTAAWSQVR